MMKKPATPITRRKLSHEVLDRLLHQIESGETPPGSRLPSERELMEMYGVGRPAVREALQTLENMGLISITHGERARVNVLDAHDMLGQIDRTARYLLSTSPATLEHLKEARVLFEMAMVRQAVEKATDAQVQELQDIVSEMEQAAGDSATFVAADLKFHSRLAAISGNNVYAALSTSMLKWLRDFHFEMVHAPGLENTTLVEHRRIVERIAARDAEGAAKAMSDHLLRAHESYRKHLAQPS